MVDVVNFDIYIAMVNQNKVNAVKLILCILGSIGTKTWNDHETIEITD